MSKVTKSDTKTGVGHSAYHVMLGMLNKQVKTKKNKHDWGELKVFTEVDKKAKRKYIKLEAQSIGFCFNMRGDFLGIYNWKG